MFLSLEILWLNTIIRESPFYPRVLLHFCMVLARDAEPEPLEPTDFGRSRSRSRRNGLLGAGAGAGAVKNGAAPAPKRDTIVARKNKTKAK